MGTTGVKISMAHSTSEEKGKKSFMISTLTIFLSCYLFFSLLRFFIYDEPILSKDPIVILMAILITGFLIVNSWLKPFLNINLTQKKYRYFLWPVSFAIVTYIFISLIRFVIVQDSILTKDLEVITFAVMIGIFEGLEAKIDDISPRDPKKEPNKPLKYYIDKFIINPTPFHKVMFFVYGFCILFLILILWLAI